MSEIRTCEQYVLSELQNLKFSNSALQGQVNDLISANNNARGELNTLQAVNGQLQEKLADLEIEREKIRVAVTNMLLCLSENKINISIFSDDYVILSAFAKGE